MTPTLSVASLQEMVTSVGEFAITESIDGMLGGVISSGAGVVTDVSAERPDELSAAS